MTKATRKFWVSVAAVAGGVSLIVWSGQAELGGTLAAAGIGGLGLQLRRARKAKKGTTP